MAKAELKTVEVTPAREAVYREEVTLTLSRDEAESLKSLTGFIGGSPVRSRRKHFDSISQALWVAGIHNVDMPRDFYPFGLINGRQSGSIYFKDEEGI
jgi:hypothetical protein